MGHNTLLYKPQTTHSLIFLEDSHQKAVLHFRYFPSVRADKICVSCHKHHRDVFCAVFFITSIVINGSLGPLRQQD